MVAVCNQQITMELDLLLDNLHFGGHIFETFACCIIVRLFIPLPCSDGGFNVYGFINNTWWRPLLRWHQYTQKLPLNGWKKNHSMKWQTFDLSCGCNGHVFLKMCDHWNPEFKPPCNSIYIILIKIQVFCGFHISRTL